MYAIASVAAGLSAIVLLPSSARRPYGVWRRLAGIRRLARWSSGGNVRS
jgi:hypothetical protein